jgi:hypothetical protein
MDDTLPPRKPARGTVKPARQVLPDSETQSLPDPRERLGPYVVEAKVGEGGMGKVYRCHDPSLKRSVAIKVLHDRYSRDEYYQARFRREAETLASLSHPSIAQVFAIDTTDDGSLYIVMEFVEGRSIDDILRRDGALDGNQATALVVEVAEGLQAAFEKGIIHRDIKPSNLLVRPDGHVKIVDFGLSKDLTGKNTITDEGMVLGTPHYISPEQGRGLPVDERSDMYSLGSTFYHMITGATPFEGKSQIAVIVSHVEGDPRPPHEVRDEVSLHATAVIGRMMARDANSRYVSYADLIKDLQSVTRGDAPVFATQEVGRFGDLNTPERGSRRDSLVLLTLCLLVVGIIGGWAVGGSISEPSPPFPLAERMGDWYRPRQDGGAVLAINFANPPAESEALLSDLFLFRLDDDEGVRPPTIDPAKGALVWSNYREPIACRYPFEQVDEVQMLLGRLSGDFDLTISVVDALGSKRRRLTLCISASQATPSPITAERHGDLVEFDPPALPIPSLQRFRTKVFLELEPRDGATDLTIKIVEVETGTVKYRHRGTLPGEDWASGAVVLKTSYARPPFTLALRELVLSGRPTGSRLEQSPWQD